MKCSNGCCRWVEWGTRFPPHWIRKEGQYAEWTVQKAGTYCPVTGERLGEQNGKPILTSSLELAAEVLEAQRSNMFGSIEYYIQDACEAGALVKLSMPGAVPDIVAWLREKARGSHE